MIRGLYTAATGMITQYKKMDTISNNLANINTTGYKQDGVVTEAFPQILTKKVNDSTDVSSARSIGKMSLGTTVNRVYTNHEQGSFQETDEPLNAALQGQGFFTVQVEGENGQAEERYTRDGSFQLSPKGTLLTNDGKTVLGNQGSIQISGKDINIDKEGRIFADNIYIDTLQITNFEDLSTLRKIGDNLYASTDESVKSDFTGQVQQGFLEASNVNSVKEMVEMINIMRTYEANQKVLQTEDQALGKAVNEVGKV